MFWTAPTAPWLPPGGRITVGGCRGSVKYPRGWRAAGGTGNARTGALPALCAGQVTATLGEDSLRVDDLTALRNGQRGRLLTEDRVDTRPAAVRATSGLAVDCRIWRDGRRSQVEGGSAVLVGR